MKTILVKYHIEITEDNIDKLCFKTKSSKRDLEKDIKHMAEISGRHRVHEFIQPFIQLNTGEKKDEK
tara:strand:- start:3120 stop:3320 length:201 start_codon:yes stop_codon:yes gene_type:complete